MRIRRFVWPEARIEHIAKHGVTPEEVDELEEVSEPVFARTPVKVHLRSNEVKAVQKLAQAKRVSEDELIREWVLQRIARRNGAAPAKRRPATRRPAKRRPATRRRATSK